MKIRMVFSKSGLQLTEGFEGCKLVAYQDEGGVWTIGYGHTGKDVYEGLVITQAIAEILLAHDILTAATFVNNQVIAQLTQSEFDACVDFVFNVGVGNFLHSRLFKLLNLCQFKNAAMQFAFWDKCAGQVNKGLQRRRLSETEMFQHLEPTTEA